MARKRKLDEDDLPPLPGPKTPDPWERDEFAVRIQEILDALEISEIDRDVRLKLQRRLRRSDILRSMGICTNAGEEIILLLRTIAESSNGPDALVLPVITAVSRCMHPKWTGLGLRWIESFDEIPLLQMLQTVRDLGLEEHYDTALRHRLMQILGPPVVSEPPAPKKTPTRKMVKRPKAARMAA
jgi:hypothetical protein